MKIHLLEREQYLSLPVDEVFPFFAEARNLERITPPWLRFSVRTQDEITMEVGALIEYRLRVHGVPLRWLTRIAEWEPNRRFVDQQIKGPYALWHHTHTFESVGGGTLIRDQVRYAIGFGPIGELVNAVQVQRDLDNVFAYRNTAVRAAFGIA
jgi:ligand-binding SRPBCC domain-containing protein